MKTRNLAIILLTIISASQSLAQEFRVLTKDVYYGDFEIISTKLNYSDIAGSPYLNKDLVLGQVIF